MVRQHSARGRCRSLPRSSDQLPDDQLAILKITALFNKIMAEIKSQQLKTKNISQPRLWSLYGTYIGLPPHSPLRTACIKSTVICQKIDELAAPPSKATLHPPPPPPSSISFPPRGLASCISPPPSRLFLAAYLPAEVQYILSLLDPHPGRDGDTREISSSPHRTASREVG